MIEQATRIQGMSTYQEFFSSLPPGEYYIQERELDGEFSYYPVDDLFAGVPASADEWKMQVIVCWTKEGRAVITRPVARAKTRAVLHKSLLPARYQIVKAESAK